MSKSIRKNSVMHIPFVSETMDDVMQKIVRPASEQLEKCFIVTANPEIVMAAQKDKSFHQLLQQADYIVPDGIGIIMAAKWKKVPLEERIPGVELMDQMLQLANERGLSVYFLGATEEVNKKAVENIHATYPYLRVAGAHHGYMELEDEQLAGDIQATSPDFIFVALGSPKQEQWIHLYQDTFKKGIFMGVGGSFDVYAGNVKRAPAIWIKLRLEWFYRLLQQPARFKRIGPLISFVFQAIFKK